MMKLHARKDSTSALKILVASGQAGLSLPLVEWNDENAKALGVVGARYNVVLDTPKGAIGGGDAVLRYVGRVRPEVGLYGETLFEAAEVDMWLQFSAELENNLFPETPATANEVAVADYLKTLNDHLLHNTYIVGQLITLADISVAIVLHQGEVVGKHSSIQMQNYPNIKRWYSTISQQKAFIKVIPAGATSKPAPNKKKQISAQEKTAAKVQNGVGSADNEEEEEAPVEIPILDKWKKLYSNSKNRLTEALPWFYKELDLKNTYSVWHMRYNKLPNECKFDFVTSNLLAGFMQRINNAIRGESFGMIHVLGENGDFDIEGVWLFTGQEIPDLMKQHPSFEYHQFTKLNVEKQEDLACINSFWCEKEVLNGRPIVTTEPWK